MAKLGRKYLTGWCAVGFFMLAGLTMTVADNRPHQVAFTLATSCPPSFIKDDNGLCAFTSLYDRYAAPEGYGGLRAPMPALEVEYSPQEIDLGRLLFFDPLLSGDQTLSCAHCHHPDHGFSDGQGRSIGTGGTGAGLSRRDGEVLPRATPSLWNVAFFTYLTWDGRAQSLQEQAEGPLFNPSEMGTTRKQLETRLSENDTYQRLFSEVYGADETRLGITTEHITRALAAFESSLISLNSRYDRYAHGDHDALSKQEKNGHSIFRSFVTRCSQCHTPPLFTNSEMAVIGAGEPEGKEFDAGAEIIFDDKNLRGGFKIPSLRNVAKTAPYMHSGRFETLNDVVTFYNGERGHMAPEGEELLIHWHIAYPNLNDNELVDLVAFLGTLSDDTMLPETPAAVPSGLPVIETKKQSPAEG